MGFIATVLDFIRTTGEGENIPEVKIDAGGADGSTPAHFSAPGDDSPPLPGDYAAVINTAVDENGATVGGSVGYVDPENAGTAAAGEKRTYARDASGTPVSEIWSKADGSVLVTSIVGGESMLMDASGNIVFNGGSDWVTQFTAMKTAFDQLKAEVTAIATAQSGVNAGHVHPVPGNPAVPTPPPLPPVTADMSGAKVETMKVP